MPFQKGNRHGKGRPPVGADQAEANKITKTMMLELFGRFLNMDIDRLEQMLSDRTKPVAYHIIGRVALMAIKEGDPKRLDFFMDRLYGKVSQEIKHSVVEPLYVEYADGSGVALTAATKQIEGLDD